MLRHTIVDFIFNFIFYVQEMLWLRCRNIVGVSEMLDDVKVTKKTEAPVEKREEKKYTWDNLPL